MMIVASVAFMPTFARKIVSMRFIAIALVFLITTVASCSKDDNEMPEINIETIVIKGQGKSVDDLHVGDTVSVYLNLQSNKKDLNSFSCKFASAEDFSLRILDIDSTTTNYEGNNLSSSPDEDCTVTFRDGTYLVDLTVEAVINDHRSRYPQLRLFLFSEKETAQREITFTMSPELPDNVLGGIAR